MDLYGPSDGSNGFRLEDEMPRHYTEQDLEDLGYYVRPKKDPVQGGGIGVYLVSRDGVTLEVPFYGFKGDRGTEIATSRKALLAAYREMGAVPPEDMRETEAELQARADRGLTFVRVRIAMQGGGNDNNAPADPDPARMVAEHNNDGGEDPNDAGARIDADFGRLELMSDEEWDELVRKTEAPRPEQPSPRESPGRGRRKHPQAGGNH